MHITVLSDNFSHLLVVTQCLSKSENILLQESEIGTRTLYIDTSCANDTVLHDRYFCGENTRKLIVLAIAPYDQWP